MKCELIGIVIGGEADQKKLRSNPEFSVCAEVCGHLNSGIGTSKIHIPVTEEFYSKAMNATIRITVETIK